MAERGAALSSWLEKNARWVTLGLVALALIPRLWIAFEWAKEPVWDGHYYHFGATRIASGVGYGDERSGTFRPWCHYPVGYSAFVGFFYKIFGSAPQVATAVQALVGAATVALVHRFALTFLSPVRALLAGLLCAGMPNLVLYSGLVMTEPLAGFGLLLAPYVFTRLQKRPVVAALAAGAVFGLTTLVRPQTILCAPAIALFVAGSGAGVWRALAPRLLVAGVSLGACLLVVLPWTARNCVMMDDCAFVSTNAGWNLAIGSSPRATGRFSPVTAEDGCGDVRGQVDQDRCFARLGSKWIRQDPVRWIGLADEKLSYTYDHQSFAVGYLAEASPNEWPEERRAFYRRLMTIAQYVLILFAALGALVLPRERAKDMAITFALALAPILFMDGLYREPNRIWPLAALLPVFAVIPPLGRSSGGKVEYLAWCVATLSIIHVLFFGEDRYQVVVTPALVLLAASAFRRRIDPESSSSAAG